MVVTGGGYVDGSVVVEGYEDDVCCITLPLDWGADGPSLNDTGNCGEVA